MSKFIIKESQLRKMIKQAIKEAVNNQKYQSKYWGDNDPFDVYQRGNLIRRITRAEIPAFEAEIKRYGETLRDYDFRAPSYDNQFLPNTDDDCPSYLNCSKESKLHNIIKESVRKTLNESNDIQTLCYEFHKWLQYDYNGMHVLGQYMYSNDLSPKYVIDEFIEYHPEYKNELDDYDYNELQKVINYCIREEGKSMQADDYNSSMEAHEQGWQE
jgi:hypothetical protein